MKDEFDEDAINPQEQADQSADSEEYRVGYEYDLSAARRTFAIGSPPLYHLIWSGHGLQYRHD